MEWLRRNSLSLERVVRLMMSMDSNPRYWELIIEAFGELTAAD